MLIQCWVDIVDIGRQRFAGMVAVLLDVKS